MEENLVGYLIGALDPETEREVADYLTSHPEERSKLDLLRSALAPLKQGRRRPRRGAPPRNYERLEFLGDRVLGLVVADLLWRRFGDEPEGHLTRRLAHLVRRETLARVALTIGLGGYVIWRGIPIDLDEKLDLGAVARAGVVRLDRLAGRFNIRLPTRSMLQRLENAD